MPLRFLFRFLANNEKLVSRLSESYVVRKTAQFAVKAFYQGKEALQESGVDPKAISPSNIKTVLMRLARNFKSDVNEVKQDVKNDFSRLKDAFNRKK